MGEFTDDELAVLNLSAELYSAISKLPKNHPSSMAETERDIQAIQNRIMARAASRANPEFFGLR